MNGLDRQYFPKGTDFKTITPAALAHTERKLNKRKCLAFKTPIEVFYSPENN
jgi:IS30 family transposase